jgi:hypothetical protein
LLYKLHQVKVAIFVLDFSDIGIFCCAAVKYRRINAALTTPVS